MMILNYLKNIEFLKSNRATGLHCYVNGGNTPVFSYVILGKKKGKIEIEQQGEIHCDFEQLAEIIPVKYPVYLSIDGKGILHRQVECDSSIPALQLAIPNANENDFVSEQFDGTSQKKYISFARKEFIDDILAKLSDQNFPVIGLTISPFSCLGLFDIFPELPVPFMVGQFEFELDRETSGIIAFSKIELAGQDRKYTIGGNEISSAKVLPFYNALSYYTNRSDRPEYSVVSNQKAEYISKRLFEIAGWGALIFLFIILLANLVMFSNLSEEKQQLDLIVSGNKELITRLNRVKEELSWKEKFLGQVGNDRKKWFSFFADRVGASVPEEITLEKLDFHPVRSKIINQKEIELQPDLVRIEGITKNSLSVNNWALILKKMTGVSDVVIGSFSQMENSTLGVFAIEIRLKVLKN
jgi:Tfp pilus assembly protein PilN